jgi:hypothetical protein
MATLQSLLSNMSDDALKNKISALEGIIVMQNTGATRDEILEKYGSFPDNPRGDLETIVSEYEKRGFKYEPKRGVGFNPSREYKNIKNIKIITISSIFIGLLVFLGVRKLKK